MPERILLARVQELAARHGWWWHHEFDSRRGTAGLPDLLLLKAPRPPLWVELKREGGRLRPGQLEVIALLRECGQDVRIWRPSSWDEITETLQGGM
jgi:hypothetical protein